MIESNTRDADAANWTGGLLDSARTIRRQRVLIGAIALVGLLLGLGSSFLQASVYRAQASVAFTDESRDLSVIGDVAVRAQEPDQLAASNAKTVTRRALVSEVRNRLKLKTSVDELQKRFTAGVEPTSNLVVISAEAPTASEASRLANALASAAVDAAQSGARGRYARAAAGVRQRIEALRGTATQSARVGLQNELTRLESLSVLASPARIAEEATRPGGRAAPKPVRNTVLGGLLGLLFGTLAAYSREIFDRRLRSSREIEERLGLPVVGHVGEDAMGRVAWREDADAPARGLEAFRILLANLLFLQRDSVPRRVGVTSALPAEGKTTVAIALAAAMALSGKRTLLIECDLRRAPLAERLGLERRPGLTDYLSGTATPAEVLQRVTLPPDAGQDGARSDGPRCTRAEEDHGSKWAASEAASRAGAG